MKVIVGASSVWPTPNLASKILSIMISEPFEPIGVRVNNTKMGETSSVELMVVKIANRIDLEVVRWPAGGSGTGSSIAFKRDVEMVRAASGVYAFIGPECSADEGGTQHVLACALRDGIPVIAYGVEDDGSFIEIGSDAGSFWKGINSPWGFEEVGWRK